MKCGGNAPGASERRPVFLTPQGALASPSPGTRGAVRAVRRSPLAAMAPSPRSLSLLLAAALAAAGLVLTAPGCRKLDPPSAAARKSRQPAADPRAFLNYYQPTPIGAPMVPNTGPWVAHVIPVDLDRDGLLDVLACEAKDNKVVWIRQVSRGKFEETVLDSTSIAPVHVEPADLDGDGDLDLMVSVMGYVFPNNDKIGEVVLLENDGHQRFTRRVILANTSRVTDIRAADFDEDGQLDLAVGQFGYDQGEVRWMRRTGPWTFESEILIDLSGDINVCVADFNGDGHQDIAALISQQWEEIYVFLGDGKGRFTRRKIWGSTNEDYGSSGISIADVNGDSRPDILYSNGDGFGPAATPGPRPWHGVQWLENTGAGNFAYHRIGDLPGAYSPVGVDVDHDGRMDIVAVAAYADWDKINPLVASLVWFRNEGNQRFTKRVLASEPKDLLTLGVGDFDGTGEPVFVTGGFPVYPPYERIARVTLWRKTP